MVDHVILSAGEEIKFDTTNNTITIVLTDNGNIEIRNENDIVFAYLQSPYEMYTLAVYTPVDIAKVYIS
jgi:hypothetical protein